MLCPCAWWPEGVERSSGQREGLVGSVWVWVRSIKVCWHWGHYGQRCGHERADCIRPGLHDMKAIDSHRCGQIAKVSLAQSSCLVNGPPGHYGTKASCASSLPVSSLSSLSLSPVYIAGVIVIVHGTKASFKQTGRLRECCQPPVNMAQRPILSKRLVMRASPTGHYGLWHEGQFRQRLVARACGPP